jgi:hypothetical protein
MDEMDEELKSCLRTLEQRLCSDNDLLDYREELMPFKRWISRETIVRSFELEGGFFDANIQYDIEGSRYGASAGVHRQIYPIA